jgi:hypothetical protein
MKKTLTVLCLAGTLFAVSACSGYTTYEQEPYRGRTAGPGVMVSQQTDNVVETRSAEPIFRAKQRK